MRKEKEKEKKQWKMKKKKKKRKPSELVEVTRSKFGGQEVHW